MSRLTTAGLLALAGELSETERGLVRELARLKLATHAQLAALLPPLVAEASAASRARTARRMLARLTDLRVLARLERRIGGIRAGSAGYVYYLGPVGQRLIAYWQGEGLVRGRVRPEPGSRYVRHRLSVSELYVCARQAEREGLLDLLAFDIEPESWRVFQDGFGGQVTLKPDAFARLGVGAYEDRFFIEVDLGSESKSVIARKVRAYLDYWNSGQEQTEHGVFPRVLLLTNSETRRAALVDVCARLPAESWPLFTVATLERGVEVMGGQIEDDAHQSKEASGESA
jgi:Replication-relaxation